MEQARRLDRLGREIEVLILVKTTPTPSTTYEDTVCVAGLALSPGPPRWVRLYPIPFRHLSAEAKFTKYAVVRTRVALPHSDPRAESLRVADVSKIDVIRELGPWKERCDEVLRAPETTACTLNAATKADPNGPSLGIVRPLDVTLETRPHPGWTEKQRRIITMWQEQTALPLDRLTHNNAPPLECPPLAAWYRYRCADVGCPGHRQGILDWELTALQRKAKARGGDVEEWVRNNFETKILAEDRQAWFVLGNNAAANKRTSFSVLSVFWPTSKDVQASQNTPDPLF